MLALVLWLLACLLPHLAARLLFRRSNWPRRFLAGTAWICGARVRLDGAPLRPHSLLVANHISWLDILVLGGATGCAFVSKDNLGHGVIHWLADQNHTLYVSRQDRRAARGQAAALAAALTDPRPVAVFPEGTVGPGDILLPFRSPLLQAVIDAPGDVEVRPVALDYGPAATEISWHGESGEENVLRVLGRRGPLPVTVRLLAPVDPAADRKVLAAAARDSIAQALASAPRAARLYANRQ